MEINDMMIAAIMNNQLLMLLCRQNLSDKWLFPNKI